MTPDDLDRILSAEDDLEPSSDFSTDVMANVRWLGTEPRPLTFPWFRFATGLAASGMMAAAGTLLLLRSGPALITATAPLAPLAAVAPEFGYATAAALLSVGLASVPRLLTRL